MAEDFLSQMVKATQEATGATPATEVATQTDDSADDVEETAEDAADAAAPEGQPAAKPDPWATVKQKYTPEKIAELEREAEEAKHAKAMRREASTRNEEAAKLRAEAEADKRATREALDRVNLMTESLASISDQNPELGAQLLATFRRAAGRDEGGVTVGVQPPRNGGSGQSGDRRIEALQAELESLKKSHAEAVVGLNTRELSALAWRAVESDSLLNRQAIKDLGIPDRVVQNAVQAVYEKDRAAAPDERINPYDMRALEKAVVQAVKDEVATYGKLRSAIITDYRTEKKAKHAGLPPSSKGANASVRSGPASSPPPPANAPRAKREAYWVEQMMNATRPVKRGEVS